MQTPIVAKEAIDRGYQAFRDIMQREQTPRVLLEGLNYDHERDIWIVTFGFDSERKKAVSGLQRLLVSSRSLYDEGEFEIVREFRSILLSGHDGSFVRMEHS